MSSYDLDYALARLREAIDYAEVDGDFQPARKWVNEVEKAVQQSAEPTYSKMEVTCPCCCEMFDVELPV